MQTNKDAEFRKVVIRVCEDGVYASPIGEEGRLYKVIANPPFSFFVKDGVVCNALVVGGCAYIIRSCESVLSTIEFSPEYVADIAKDESRVLIIRPLKNESAWVSSRNFKKHLKRIRAVIENNGLYMLQSRKRKRGR